MKDMFDSVGPPDAAEHSGVLGGSGEQSDDGCGAGRSGASGEASRDDGVRPHRIPKLPVVPANGLRRADNAVSPRNDEDARRRSGENIEGVTGPLYRVPVYRSSAGRSADSSSFARGAFSARRVLSSEARERGSEWSTEVSGEAVRRPPRRFAPEHGRMKRVFEIDSRGTSDASAEEARLCERTSDPARGAGCRSGREWSWRAPAGKLRSRPSGPGCRSMSPCRASLRQIRLTC